VDQINALEPQVHEVTGLTTNLRAERSALRRFNRPVYDAATKTMQYAAFFRYVRKHNAVSWAAFMAQLGNVTVAPQVKTPTLWSH
jgi:hypothetical protein